MSDVRHSSKNRRERSNARASLRRSTDRRRDSTIAEPHGPQRRWLLVFRFQQASGQDRIAPWIESVNPVTSIPDCDGKITATSRPATSLAAELARLSAD